MPSVFLFGSAARARIQEKRTAECPGYERELSDHSASIGMYDYGQIVPIAMCVIGEQSRDSLPFAAVQMGVLGRTLNCPPPTLQPHG